MIELKGIHKIYKMGDVEVRALSGIDLTIESGEFVAIMGQSGSGKSTLMHVLGLLDKPDQGHYALCGRRLDSLSDTQSAFLRNSLMGFVFQQFHLLARTSALDNAALPLIYAGKRQSKDRAKQHLEAVGLSARLLHQPNELSGGQQQRVAIARALVNDPLMILADEPTGNLDSKSQEEILSLLKSFNDKGKTLIIVTHEEEIARYAKRVIKMCDGKIISDTRRKEITARSADERENVCALIDTKQHKAAKAEFLDFLRQAFFAIASHKVRSFLSILGILIGVAAVIAMLALGEGASDSIRTQLSSLGTNLLVVRPGSTRLHGVALESGSVTRFTFSDVAAMEQLPPIKHVSPSVSARAQLVFEDKNWNTQLEGVNEYYEIIRNARPLAGRFFTESEVARREKVVLLGMTVARELFGQANPVGQTIKINLNNFKVIGVLPSKGASGFRDQDDVVIVPVTTAMNRLLGKDYIDTIYIEVKDASRMQEASDAVSQAIIRQHKLKKNDQDSFQVRNMSDIREMLESTTRTMSILLGSIAAISLLVGGIGIMNIMLVSVTERTREIGLRKAIGANNNDIMLQFLIEASIMTTLGGLFGIALGVLAAYLITALAGWAVKVSMFSVVLAAGFSVIVGLIFGLWPARQASRLNPIEALRYE